VIAASSATGWSLVPPVAITMRPMPSGGGIVPATAMRASGKYSKPIPVSRPASSSAAASVSRRVMSTACWPAASSAAVIARICSGVLPEP